MPVKKILPGAAIIISLYISILFALGLIIGYLGTTYVHKKALEKGKLKLVFLNFGRWKIHLHHWLIGVLALFVIWIIGWMYVLPNICLGAILGLTCHDLYTDKEWFKVILRKPK